MFGTGELKAIPALLLLFLATDAVALCQETAPGRRPIKKREPTKFIRIQHDEFREPQALQTATVKYVLRDDAGQVRVEAYLESVVHIGDAAYYRGFNRRFANYDAVLYELVAETPHRIPDRREGAPHPARLLQQLFGDSMGFKHQIDRINYKADNMVHADLSLREMADARRQRGDDEMTMLADMMLQMLRQANNAPRYSETADPIDLDILSDPDGSIKLRRMLARTLDDTVSPAPLLPPTVVRNLIDDRNQRAMDVFQEQLDRGKRRVAFFWGAAHMPDLEKRLILDYGFQRDSVRWRNAWDLREGSVERAPLDSAIETAVRSFVDGALDELFATPTVPGN